MNLVIICTNAKSGATHYAETYSLQYCIPAATVDKVLTYGGISWLNTAYRRVLAKVNDVAREKILTDFIPEDKIIPGHDVDMAWTNSIIKQETF